MLRSVTDPGPWRDLGVERSVLDRDSLHGPGRSGPADTLEITPSMTPDDIRADLRALEQLWREKLAAELQY
jgi:hypothetical protein